MVEKVFVVAPVAEECGWRRPLAKESIWNAHKKSSSQQVANVAVGCPFCLTMLEDGMKELDKEEEIKTQDIAELVAMHMA